MWRSVSPWQACAAALAGSGISPDVVVLIKPRTLPKTTSGKVRRSGVKQVRLHTVRPPLLQKTEGEIT